MDASVDHMQRPPAVPLTRILHPLRIPSAQHVVGYLIPITRLPAILVRHDRHRHLLQLVRHLPVLRSRPPARRYAYNPPRSAPERNSSPPTRHPAEALSDRRQTDGLQDSGHGELLVDLQEGYVVVVGAAGVVAPVPDHAGYLPREDLGFEGVGTVVVQEDRCQLVAVESERGFWNFGVGVGWSVGGQ